MTTGNFYGIDHKSVLGVKLLKVSQKARAKLLREVKDAFRDRSLKGKLAIKFPFDLEASDLGGPGREWAWVDVVTWAYGLVHGRLLNDMIHLPLVWGDVVRCSEGDAFDYVVKVDDVVVDGGTTAAFIKKAAAAGKKGVVPR